MNDFEIIEKLKEYFDIREFVGKETYRKFGDTAWKFFNIRILHAALIVRENIDKPMTINNYKWGGSFSQRGLRTNVQQIFRKYFAKKKLYLSAHVLAMGIDFDVKGMAAEDVRKWIESHADLFPFKIRLEDGVNWVHMDVIQEQKNSKIYRFKV